VPSKIPATIEALIRRHQLAAFFALTFSISWLGALAVAAPQLMRHEPLPKMTGALMFPLMLIGPSFSGILLTKLVSGSDGLRDLWSRMSLASFPVRWYAALLLPPVLVLTVLLLLQTSVSQGFAPNRYVMGVLFAVPAGFLEEIGWMGYAFPRMRSHGNGLGPGIALGLLWALWHLPVIDYLGTASPHGCYWLPFFLAFTFAMTAMRVLIAWLYLHTHSVLLAQLMHISSTGSLVVFGAWRVSAAQEALWYALYGVALWLVVSIVARNAAK
jgi:membrane protease YdiL (CAAX protease family)